MTRPLVILVYPKIDHEKDYVYFWMPFSLLAVAKSLLDQGLADVLLFDGNLSGEAEWASFLDEHLDRAICVGFSIMTGGGQIGHALRMAQTVKARSKCPPLVFGGPHVNVLAEETFAHPLVDAVLGGQGQLSMPPFVAALLGQLPYEDVPGFLMKCAEVVRRGTPNLPVALEMSKYPWRLLPVERYIRNDPTVAERTLNYISSQGCVYPCRFCYELTYKRKYSAISAQEMLDDVEWLVQHYGINGVKFYDADWFIDPRRSIQFCEGLVRRNLGIRWAASIHPNDVLRSLKRDQNFLPLLVESGCSRLLMGVESGSDRVLKDVVDKRVTRQEVLQVATEIARAGILGSYTFIVGFPGETAAEQSETFSLIEELWQLSPRPETRVHIFAPYPGTPLYEEARRHGFNPPNSLDGWSHYDYYDSQTPWTDKGLVAKARHYTRMTLSPKAVEQPREKVNAGDVE